GARRLGGRCRPWPKAGPHALVRPPRRRRSRRREIFGRAARSHRTADADARVLVRIRRSHSRGPMRPRSLAALFLLAALALAMRPAGAGADRSALPVVPRADGSSIVALRAAGPSRILIRAGTFTM